MPTTIVKAFSSATLILVDGVPDARGRTAGLYELQRGRVDGQPAWRSLVSPDSGSSTQNQELDLHGGEGFGRGNVLDSRRDWPL